MTASLHFLPWLRRGLGLAIGERDRGQQLPRGGEITAAVDLDGEEAAVTVALRPPDHVTAIDASQIIRRYPQPNTVDAEYGYFPLIEFGAPDLPWVLTPAAPDEAADDPNSTGRLRPWLVLVCVEEDSAQYVAGDADRPARLICPTSQLPDLAESYAWAHVQSTTPPSDVLAALEDAPGSVIARLVCPRRLAPSTRYRAAVVGAFAAVDGQLVPAWGQAESADLTVYSTWTFATGEAGSFQELCLRLGPVDDENLQLGLHPLDVTELGAVDPWPDASEPVTVDYTGALWDVGLRARGLGERKEAFDTAVSALLEQGSHRVVLDPRAPDPVVTPPMYGSFPAATHDVPDRGWLRQVNLSPNRRTAAGLGASVVREHQERFIAQAWRQAGALRETNRELSVTRLQAEIGRTWRHRANRLDGLQRVAVLRPQLTFVRDDSGQAPRRLLADSTFPDALASPAYLRQARPGGVVAAAAARRRGRGDIEISWRTAVATSFGSPATRRQMRFAEVGVPAGTTLAGGGGAGASPVDRFALSDVARLTATGVRPIAAARARITARIPALAGQLGDGAEHELPTRVRWGPTIDEALVWSLIERSPELLVPGVGEFPPNSVRMVEGNPAFVASFLAGANHEMSRELLWREFPADLRATTFHRFWDRPNGRDIEAMAGWPEDAVLGELGAAGGESVVLLIRGDLVMHYPTVRILLADPDGNETSPSFAGWIPPDVRFVGFDVTDSDTVTAPGSEWMVVFEEQPCEPRFGLDTGEGDERLTDWNKLTWQHLDNQDGASHLVVGDGGFPCATQPAPPGATWGLNAAHMARVTYRPPFRGLFRVTDLVGES